MSRSSVTKENAFQAAPGVIPILDGSCTRLKRLLRLCDQQIDSIEQDSGMPGPAKGKELQILVRMVLNLQKDLLKYTQALHPDVPVKPAPQTTGKLRKEDLEALSDSQLHELMPYLIRDDEDNEVDIQGIVDRMLNRSPFPEKIPAEKGASEIRQTNQPSPTDKTSPLKLRVQSRHIETRQPETRHPPHGDTRPASPSESMKGRVDHHPINRQQPPHSRKQPGNRKHNKPPHGPTRDPTTE